MTTPDWPSRRATHREQEWTIAQQCFTLASNHFQRLLGPEPPKGLVTEALRLFAAASKYGRLACQPDPEVTPQTPPGAIPPLPPSAVAALDRVYGPKTSPPPDPNLNLKPNLASPDSPPPPSTPSIQSIQSIQSTPTEPTPPPATGLTPPPPPPLRPRLNHDLTPCDAPTRPPCPPSPSTLDTRHSPLTKPKPKPASPPPRPAPIPERRDVTPVPLRRGLPALNYPSPSDPYLPFAHNEFYLWWRPTPADLFPL